MSNAAEAAWAQASTDPDRIALHGAGDPWARYAVTKHAAVAFSEWLSVTYGDRGIGVSCLCPMGVNANMLNGGLESDDEAEQLGAKVVAHAGTVLEPEEGGMRRLQGMVAGA